MFKLFIFLLSGVFSCQSCSEQPDLPDMDEYEYNKSQIIADHRIVNDFRKIPDYYLNEVKKMMVGFAGESHSEAYRVGMKLLESEHPSFRSNISAEEGYTDQYLRVNINPSTGEEQWFTWYAYPSGSRPLAATTIKNLIKRYFDRGHPLHVLGFAWCYDMQNSEPTDAADPEYEVRWRGDSKGGPQGDLQWGLDAEDFTITSNHVCLDTYIDATQEYIDYCIINGYPTKIVFTTGTVDSFASDYGYQAHLKNERIRNYVATDTTRILFDYADILCFDDNGKQTTRNWNGHTYPFVTSVNLGDRKIGHIGSAGAIRLAKAQWWMLARIAGWDGK